MVLVPAAALLVSIGLQHSGSSGGPDPFVHERDLPSVRHVIAGRVNDLALDSLGRILYVTAEREVGRLVPGGGRQVLATVATGSFPNELRAVADAAGHVAVLDSVGNIRLLPNGVAPSVLLYSDLYMILDPTDLVVDAGGNWIIASKTPSSGQRAINWVGPSGVNWAYYLVDHQPVALAADPLTGSLLFSESTAGGNLRLVQPGSPIRATLPLDTTTHPGIDPARNDGDLAVQQNGDVFWIANGSVYRHRRATGATTLFATGFETLRGIVIAAGSGYASPPGGWSLYLAEGAYPTRIRELPGVGAPAGVVPANQGTVPGRGTRVNVNFGFNAFELALDNAGRMLVGGAGFGGQYFVKRVTLSGTPSIATVATTANGLSGTIEGLCVAADDAIYALTREGRIQRITEGPTTVTTVFNDVNDMVVTAKDLAQDVNGSVYIAERNAWGSGRIFNLSLGGLTLLRNTAETRGLAANPGGGMLFSQWHNSGFFGTVDLLHFADNTVEVLPGFDQINYANDGVFGDGDICVDAEGTIYTIAEDEWSLLKYHADLDGFERIGSAYGGQHPSGLALGPSTAGSGSTTGWSLYASDYFNLWEKPSFPPPAPTLVDASLGIVVGRTLGGAAHPRYGKPNAAAPAPVAGGTGLLVGTRAGWLLAFDPATGAFEPVAGPDDGLEGEVLALASSPDGRRFVVVTDRGVFELVAGRVRPVRAARETLEVARARFAAEPQRLVRVLDRRTRTDEWFQLDGWAVWRITGPR